MKPFEKFLNNILGTKELLETYLELRQHFQELGFSEDDLKKPPIYTEKMMKLFHKYNDTQKDLLNQIKSFGFDVDFNEFTEYIQPLLQKINELTPLKEKENVNNKRGNNWDED